MTICRETTVLEAKLEKLAGLIGQIGLGAGLLAFGALASQFSWQKFVVEGQSWDWSYAPDYLRFLITSITILVYFTSSVSACSFKENAVQLLVRPLGCCLVSIHALDAICLAVRLLTKQMIHVANTRSS